MQNNPSTQRSALLSLPHELCVQILRNLLVPGTLRLITKSLSYEEEEDIDVSEFTSEIFRCDPRVDLSILRTCKAFDKDGRQVFHQENTFIVTNIGAVTRHETTRERNGKLESFLYTESVYNWLLDRGIRHVAIDFGVVINLAHHPESFEEFWPDVTSWIDTLTTARVWQLAGGEASTWFRDSRLTTLEIRFEMWSTSLADLMDEEIDVLDVLANMEAFEMWMNAPTATTQQAKAAQLQLIDQNSRHTQIDGFGTWDFTIERDQSYEGDRTDFKHKYRAYCWNILWQQKSSTTLSPRVLRKASTQKDVLHYRQSNFIRYCLEEEWEDHEFKSLSFAAFRKSSLPERGLLR